MADGARAFPVIADQRELATHRQLRDAGWSESAIRHARRTTWQQPYAGAFAPHRGPLPAQTRLLAAALWARGDAALTGLLALRERGLATPYPQTAWFVVPDAARARRSGDARTVRSARQPEVTVVRDCLRVVTPGRALLDAAVLDHPAQAELEALTIALLQRGLAVPDEVHHECWFRPQSSTGGVRAGLDAFTAGAWSRPERVLREVVTSAGDLPELLVNVALETPTGRLVGVLDGYLEAAGVGIQVHSRAYHQGFDDLGGDRWAATVEHDADFTAEGVRVVGVTPWTLYRRPERFVTRLRSAVRHGLLGPRPQVRVRSAGTDPRASPA